MRINLGDKARDIVTGFEGICVARTQWLSGCARITLLPDHLDGAGKPFESMTIDEPQAVLVEACVVSRFGGEAGGPMPAPQQLPDPVR